MARCHRRRLRHGRRLDALAARPRAQRYNQHVGTGAQPNFLHAHRALWRATRDLSRDRDHWRCRGGHGVAVSPSIPRREPSLSASVKASEGQRHDDLPPHRGPRRPRPRSGSPPKWRDRATAHLTDNGLVTLVDRDRGAPSWRADELATLLMDVRTHRHADARWVAYRRGHAEYRPMGASELGSVRALLDCGYAWSPRRACVNEPKCIGDPVDDADIDRMVAYPAKGGG
jgi:hypothetical protein